MAIPNFDISSNIANYGLENQYFNAHRQSSEDEYYQRLEFINKARIEVQAVVDQWNFESISIELKNGAFEGFQILLKEKWQPQHYEALLGMLNNRFTLDTLKGFLSEDKKNALSFIRDLALKLNMGEIKGSEYVVYTDYDWLKPNESNPL